MTSDGPAFEQVYILLVYRLLQDFMVGCGIGIIPKLGNRFPVPESWLCFSKEFDLFKTGKGLFVGEFLF